MKAINEIDQAAEEYCSSKGYQSDKEQFTTTPWTEWNIREDAFKAGARWQRLQLVFGEIDEKISQIEQQIKDLQELPASEFPRGQQPRKLI